MLQNTLYSFSPKTKRIRKVTSFDVLKLLSLPVESVLNYNPGYRKLNILPHGRWPRNRNR